MQRGRSWELLEGDGKNLNWKCLGHGNTSFSNGDSGRWGVSLVPLEIDSADKLQRLEKHWKAGFTAKMKSVPWKENFKYPNPDDFRTGLEQGFHLGEGLPKWQDCCQDAGPRRSVGSSRVQASTQTDPRAKRRHTKKHMSPFTP